MRAPRLTALRPFATMLAISFAMAVLSGCSQSPPAPVASGSTTGPAGNSLTARDAVPTDDPPTPSADPPSPDPITPPATETALPAETPIAEPAVTSAAPPAETPVNGPVAAVTETPSEPAPAPVAAAKPAPAADRSASWPNFRNGTDLRGIAGTTLPDNLELLWELPTHDGITATAAIDGGRAYVAELSGNVRCLDLRSGQEYWHYRTIESQDPEEFAPGFNAPVTLSERGVFVGDEEGTLHALDRETGTPLWTPFQSQGEIKGSATLLPPDPATGEPRVMFGSHDGKLYCLNAETGAKLWDFDTLGPVNGSQAVGTDATGAMLTFVAGCDKPFLRIVDVSTGQQQSEIPLESLLITTPALVGNVLYFGTPDGEVIALDWSTRQQVWLYADRQRSQEIHSAPAVTDQLVVIGSRDKRLHAVDRQTGQGVWTFETRGPIDSSPVVVGERIYFGSADRNLYGVDLKGKEVWKHAAGSRVSASPAVGEGYLVIGCEGADGKLLCFGSKN